MSVIFHLAIGTHSLKEAEAYYCDKLGFELARKYDDRITLKFFGDQIVCHLSEDCKIENPKMYPNHFGATFSEEEEYYKFRRRVEDFGVHYWKEPFTRFKGKKEEHETFFLEDPSGNLLEFKYYHDPAMIY